jgi:hypothetical protein
MLRDSVLVLHLRSADPDLGVVGCAGFLGDVQSRRAPQDLEA